MIRDLDTLAGWLRATEAEQFAHVFGRDIRTGRRIDGWQAPPEDSPSVAPSIDAILMAVVTTIVALAFAVLVIIPAVIL